MLMEPTDADIDEPDKHAQLATTSDKVQQLSLWSWPTAHLHYCDQRVCSSGGLMMKQDHLVAIAWQQCLLNSMWKHLYFKDLGFRESPALQQLTVSTISLWGAQHTTHQYHAPVLSTHHTVSV